MATTLFVLGCIFLLLVVVSNWRNSETRPDWLVTTAIFFLAAGVARYLGF
jgi:hypothetical protein